MSQIDRNLFQSHSSRQRRTRFVVCTVAGALFTFGALTTLQAASDSSGHFSARQPVQGGGNRLLSGLGTDGIAADALPYAVLANVQKPAAALAPVAAELAEPANALADQPAAGDGSLKEMPVSVEQAALAAIDEWARAWRNKDVDAYLAAYGDAFQPANGIGRDEWARQRQQRIAGKRDIQLDLRDIDVQTEAADRVWVNFVQDYRADRFVELGTAKSMLLALEDGRWRILAEESGR